MFWKKLVVALAVVLSVVLLVSCETSPETLVETGEEVREEVSNAVETSEDVGKKVFQSFPCKIQFSQISEGLYPKNWVASRCSVEQLKKWCKNNSEEGWGSYAEWCKENTE
jgi:hypothetical protein